VVDELQPQNNFSKRHVDNLLHYEVTYCFVIANIRIFYFDFEF